MLSQLHGMDTQLSPESMCCHNDSGTDGLVSSFEGMCCENYSGTDGPVSPEGLCYHNYTTIMV